MFLFRPLVVFEPQGFRGEADRIIDAVAMGDIAGEFASYWHKFLQRNMVAVQQFWMIGGRCRIERSLIIVVHVVVTTPSGLRRSDEIAEKPRRKVRIARRTGEKILPCKPIQFDFRFGRTKYGRFRPEILPPIHMFLQKALVVISGQRTATIRWNDLPICRFMIGRQSDDIKRIR